jgi:ATP-dependent DNA helicase DinG
LDPTRDQVIEAGVVFVERGQIVGRTAQLLRPSGALQLIIKRLTGLDDGVLASQPSFSEFRATLLGHLKGWTVVAHNAAFERAFMDGGLEEIGAPVLDSCEVIHYLYPELPSHSLDALVRWAGVSAGQSHRAVHDAEDTFLSLSFALRKCIEDARQDDIAELLRMLSVAKTGQLSFADAPAPQRTLLEGLLAVIRKRPARLTLEEDSAFLPGPPERLRSRPPARRGELTVSQEEIDTVLGPGGLLDMGGGFEPRDGQLELGREVARALSDGGVAAIEAATGIGKSLGYLAPAALFAAKTGAKVGVAPHTKGLQDQLIEKELPRLHKALNGAFGYAVLKGQQNYLCRRRALEVTQVTDAMTLEERAPRAYLRAFLRRSPDGDLDRISHWFRERYPVLEELMAASRSEAGTTLAERCPHFSRCFYHSAVAQAKEADVVVVNQALALRWPARYPALDHLIVDEAHELEDTATSAWSEELSDGRLGALVERLAGRRGLATTLRTRLSEELAAELTQATASLAAEAKTLGEAIAALHPADPPRRTTSGEIPRATTGELIRVTASYDPPAPPHGERRAVVVRSNRVGGERGRASRTAEPASGFERRVDAELRTTRGWVRVRDGLHGAREALEAVDRVLAGRVAEEAPTLENDDPGLDREIAGALDQCRELKLLAEHFADRPDDGRCHTAEVREWGWALLSQPVEIAGLFQSELVAPKRTLVLTSATLSTAPDAPFVLERLGLARGGHATPIKRIAGGFDLQSQALVVLVTDAPDPSSEAFVDWASTRIGGLATFLGGRVLGLFASTKRLESVDARVRAMLEPLGIEVMRQSRGSHRQLAARQEQDAGTVLLGTKAFWHGVDIPGPGVACVFIDKLPLEPQTRPIVEAREEKLGGEPNRSELPKAAEPGSDDPVWRPKPTAADFRARGFARYRLPRALLQLKQGVGRLVRASDDCGVVVIADPGSPAYRAQLYEALEGYRVEALTWAQARVRLFHFLKRVGLGEAKVARPRSEAPAQGVLFPSGE